MLEAVDVDVGHGYDALVGADEDEGRAGDRLFDPEGAPEALDERRLPRPQVARQQQEVAGPGDAGDLHGQRTGVVDRLRARRQHSTPASASARFARMRSA